MHSAQASIVAERILASRIVQPVLRNNGTKSIVWRIFVCLYITFMWMLKRWDETKKHNIKHTLSHEKLLSFFLFFRAQAISLLFCFLLDDDVAQAKLFAVVHRLIYCYCFCSFPPKKTLSARFLALATQQALVCDCVCLCISTLWLRQTIFFLTLFGLPNVRNEHFFSIIKFSNHPDSHRTHNVSLSINIIFRYQTVKIHT